MPSSNFDTVAPPPPPGLKSYGEWIFEYTRRGLPRDTPPPAGYESHKDWFERMRGLPFGEAAPPQAPPTMPSSGNSGPSSFVRRALLTAGNIANRLGAIGRGVGSALPAFGAVSTVIHAIREGRDLQGAKRPGDAGWPKNSASSGTDAPRV